MRSVWFAHVKVAIVIGAAAGLAACGGAGRGVTPPLASAPAKVIVTPSSVALGFGVHFQFQAVVVDSVGAPTHHHAVDWCLTPPATHNTI